MNSFEDLKNKVFNNRNNKTDEKPNNEKVSTFDDLKTNIRNNQNAKNVDRNYINNFLNQYNDFFSSAEKDYNQLGWGNASATYDTRYKTSTELNSSKGAIESWFKSNSNQLDDQSKQILTDILGSYDKDMSGIMNAFKSAKDYYGQWDSEEAYQRDYSLNEQYGDLSYDELLDEMDYTDDNYTKEWLTHKADSIATKDDYSNTISRNQEEIERLEEMHDVASIILDSMQNSGNDSAEYLEQQNAQLQDALGPYKNLKDLESKINQLKNDTWNTEKKLNYNYLEENADFSKLSKPSTENTSGFGLLVGNRFYGKGDAVYDYINDINGERARRAKDESDGELKKYANMSADEIARYNYIHNTQGKKAAGEYLDYLEPELDKEFIADINEEVAAYASREAGNASVLSTFATMASGIGFLDAAAQKFSNGIKEAVTGEYAGPVNYNSKAMIASNVATTIRNTVSENLADKYGRIEIDAEKHPLFARLLNGKSWGDVYQLGMSMVDSSVVAVLSTVVGPGAAYLLGGSAATQGMLDAIANGATDEQALMMGLLNGTFETIFEKYEVEHLLGADTNLLKAIFNQAITEAVGEGATSIANTFADIFVMAENSQFHKLVAEYESQGLEHSTAIREAIKDTAIQIGWDAVGGLLMGGVSGGGASIFRSALGVDNATQTTPGIDQTNIEQIDSFVPQGNVNFGSEKNNPTIKSADQQQTAEQSEQTQNEPIKHDPVKMESAAKRRLEALGETENVDTIANLAARRASGEELKRSEITTLAHSQFGAKVAKELAENKLKIDTQETEATKAKVTEHSLRDAVATAIDGKTMTVKLADGNVVDSTDMELDDYDQSTLVATVPAIEHITPEAATVAMNGYDPAAGVEVSAYVSAFDEAYTYGFNSYSMERLSQGKFAPVLSEEQMQRAYELGREARRAEYEAADSAKNTVRKEAEKGVTETEKTSKLRERFVNGKSNVYFMDGTNVTEFDENQKYTDRQKSAVKAAQFFTKMGIGGQYVFFRSEVKNGRIVFTDIDGVEKNAPNGIYRDSTGTIYIDMNAGNYGQGYTLFTLGHELTHFVKGQSKKQFAKLADYVSEAFDKTNRSMHQRVLDKQRELTRLRGEDVSYDEAFEEVVADAMSTMIADENFYDKVMEIKAKDEGLYHTIRRFFKNLVARFVREYNKLTPDQQDARDIRQMKDMFDKIQTAFAEALVEASENYQASFSAVEAEAVDSLGENARVETNAEGEMVLASNESGNVQVFSERTYLEGGREKLEKALRQNGHTDAEINQTLSYVDDALDYIKILAAGYAKNMGYTKLSNHLIAEIVTNVKTGKQVMSSIVNNGDYPVNIDLSLICKKRVAYMNLMSRLITDGVFDKVNYDGAAIAEVNSILRENGFETACLGCFVESRRLQFQTWAETIVSEWNAEVEKRNPNAGEFGFAHGKMEELTDADIDALTKELESVKKNDQGNVNLGQGNSVTRMGRLLDALPSLQKKLTVEDLLTPEGLTELRKHDGSLFSIVKSRYGAASPKIVQDFNPYASEIAMLTFAQVKDITNNAVKGAQAYVKEVSKEYGKLKRNGGETKADFDKRKKEHNQRIQDEAMRRYLYDIGGARIQSFSDFMIENVFDYIQIFADLSAKRLPLHGYTKEIVCLRLFGMTGAKWNGSLIAHVERSMGKELAGLLPAGTKDGIPVRVNGKDYVIGFDDYARNAATGGKSFIQSIGMKDIIALQLDPRYSPYVGNITIGVSDAQILAMLDSPLFRMVIPYHASGMLPQFAKLVGVDMYNDYTDYQNTTVRQYYDLDGNAVSELKNAKGDTVKADTSYAFNAEIQKTGDARTAANNYLNWCAERHPVYDGSKLVGNATYNPKFSSSPYGTDFTRHENYYKLLEDFNTYDCNTEESTVQGAVTMNFPSEANRLTAQQMDAYKNAMRETGIFSEKDIDKYAKKADMTFKEIIAAEVENRANYEASQMPKWEDTVKAVEDKLQKDYARPQKTSAEAGTKNSDRVSTGEKFSMRSPIEETADLVAFHNITPQLLMDVLNRKVLLMPSIAITNKGMTDFGEISLVFYKITIDPNANSDNKLYGADAWTPTQTQLKKNAKFDTNKTVNAVNSLKNSIGSEYVSALFNITAKQFKEAIIRADGSIYDAFAHSIGMQTAYAMEKGIISEIPTTKSGKVNRTALHEQLNAELDTDNGWRQYKKWLNNISDTVITSYDKASNEDILRNMKAQPASAKSFKLTENGELVVPAVEYGSIEDMRKNKSRLSENAAEETKAVADEFLALAKEIGNNTKSVVNAINVAFADRYNTSNIVKSFESHGIKISTETAGKLQDMYKKAVELPTQYFEAKPQREVGLNEIAAVIMPKDEKLSELKSKLEELGISVTEYNAGSKTERVKALNSVEKVKFSERGEGSSNRALIENAAKSVEEGSSEQRLIRRYQDNASKLDDLNRQLGEINSEIKNVLRGSKEAKNLSALEKKAETIVNEIDRRTSLATNLENSKGLQEIIQKELETRSESLTESGIRLQEEYWLKKEVKQIEALREYRETNAELRQKQSDISVMENEFVRLMREHEKESAKSKRKDSKNADKISNLKETVSQQKADLSTWKSEFVRLAKEYDKQQKIHERDEKTWGREFDRLVKEYEAAGRSIERLENKIVQQKENAKRIAKNRAESKERTELRHKIRKKAFELNKLLKNGKDKTHVLQDMKGFVNKTLGLVDFLFTDNISDEDLILRGITVEPENEQEAKLVQETKNIIEVLYNNADSNNPENMLSDAQFKELDAKRKKNMDKLKSLLRAQRNETLNVSAYKIFDDLVNEYASLQDSTQDAVRATYDPGLEEMLRSFIGDSERVKTLENMRAREMNADELKKLNKMLDMIVHSVRNADKVMVMGKAATVTERVKKLSEDLKARAKPDTKVGIAIQKIINKLGWDFEKPVYALDRIGSETLTELYNNLFNSENIVMEDVKDAKRFALNQIKERNYNKWNVNKKMGRTFVDNTGKEFQLTLGEMMALYAYSRRDKALKNLEFGGFQFDTTKITDPNPANTYKLSPEQCKAITDLLTEDQILFAENMQKYLSEVMGAKGNEVSMLLYGTELFEEKDYYPIHVATDFMEIAQESKAKEEAGFGSLKNAGFTKVKNENAVAPFVLGDFLETWVSHVAEMAVYHGAVPALEDIRKVMNRHDYASNNVDSTSIKQLFVNAYGREAANYFNALYQEANSGTMQDRMEKIPKKLLSFFRRNAVAYSMSVWIQQMSSISRSYAMIDRKYFPAWGFGSVPVAIGKGVKGLVNKKSFEKAYNEMLEYAPGVTLAKEIGGFDTTSGRSIKSYLMDTEKGFFETMKAGTHLEKFNKHLNFIDDNPVANLPSVMDKLAWFTMWDACKRETMANHKNLSTSSDEFLTLVGERFTEVVRATQVYDSIFSKSPMLKSKSTGVQYLVSFMNEANTTANMAEKALRDATHGNWKSARKIAVALAGSIILNNVLKSLIYAMRDDDEDETYLEKYMEAFTGGLVADLLPTSYIPYLRDVATLAQGRTVERPDLELVSDAISGINKVVANARKDTEDMTEEQLEKHEKAVIQANWKLVEALAAFGMPLKNIRRDINALINTITNTIAYDGKNSSKSLWDKIRDAWIDSIPFMATKNSGSAKIYNILISGDDEYINRLRESYDEEDDYNSAVRKALTENDDRIHTAAEAWLDDDMNTYKKIVREIRDEGFFEYEDIYEAIMSEANKIKPDSESESSEYNATDYIRAVAISEMAEANRMKSSIISYYTGKGMTRDDAEEKFYTSLQSSIKDLYDDKKISWSTAESYLVNYCDKSKDDAEELINKWRAKNETGISYDDIKDQFMAGKISSDKVAEMYVKYGGMTQEEAEWEVKILSWNKEGYETKSKTLIADYEEFCEPLRIDKDTYYNAYQFYQEAGEKGVQDSKVKECMPYIDSLPLTDSQKTALALCWWSEKTVNKFKLW